MREKEEEENSVYFLLCVCVCIILKCSFRTVESWQAVSAVLKEMRNTRREMGGEEEKEFIAKLFEIRGMIY
jgi:hypothetical protein